jgi:hypothetical protein
MRTSAMLPLFFADFSETGKLYDFPLKAYSLFASRREPMAAAGVNSPCPATRLERWKLPISTA